MFRRFNRLLSVLLLGSLIPATTAAQQDRKASELEKVALAAETTDKIASASRSMTQTEMSSYVGTYENEQVMTLFLKDRRLFLRDDTPPIISLGRVTDGAGLPVSKIGDRRFSGSPDGRSDPTLFTLSGGDEGKVKYLHLGSRVLKRR